MNDSTRASETKALWGAPDQATRLIELTSDEPHVKEAPLRRDVRSLGRLLGEVLKEQAGETCSMRSKKSDSLPSNTVNWSMTHLKTKAARARMS